MGAARLEHIKNDDLRNQKRVVAITDKCEENALGVYGHIARSS